MNGLEWVSYMELFVEQKNKNYGVIYDLILEIQNRPGKVMTKDEISNFIHNRGHYTPYFEKSLMNKWEDERENLHVLKEISKNNYTVCAELRLPPPILNIEMAYLKDILNDERMKIFLEKSTIDKLMDLLVNYDEYNIGKHIEIQGINRNMQDYNKLNEFFLLIIKSREERRLIKYTYKSEKGQIYKNYYMIPYKIEYLIRDDKYYIIYYSVEQNKVNKGIIANFTDVEISSYYRDYDMVYKRIPYIIERQKVQEPMILEVIDDGISVDRAFPLFSCFEKEAYYDRKKDICIISIYYYEYDEAEVISKILSLGKNAKVKSPKNIKMQIIQRIRKTLENYMVVE